MEKGEGAPGARPAGNSPGGGGARGPGAPGGREGPPAPPCLHRGGREADGTDPPPPPPPRGAPGRREGGPARDEALRAGSGRAGGAASGSPGCVPPAGSSPFAPHHPRPARSIAWAGGDPCGPPIPLRSLGAPGCSSILPRLSSGNKTKRSRGTRSARRGPPSGSSRGQAAPQGSGLLGVVVVVGGAGAAPQGGTSPLRSLRASATEPRARAALPGTVLVRCQ